MIVAASLKSPNCTYPSSTLKALPLECCRRSRIILIVKQSFYQLSTNCLPTVYYSLPTIYHLSTFCLPTIYQLSTNYLLHWYFYLHQHSLHTSRRVSCWAVFLEPIQYLSSDGYSSHLSADRSFRSCRCGSWSCSYITTSTSQKDFTQIRVMLTVILPSSLGIGTRSSREWKKLLHRRRSKRRCLSISLESRCTCVEGL